CRSTLLSGIGFHQIDGLAWHDGRDGVLVDELRMPVTAQEHAEIVEPGNDALQLDAIDEESRERNLVLAHVVQERVLQAWRTVCHFVVVRLVYSLSLRRVPESFSPLRVVRASRAGGGTA